MKLPLRQLARRLESSLEPAYLVAGAEPLLVAQALEQIRAAARRAGFTARELHVVERGFNWPELLASAANLSLFADRRLIEIRMAKPTPGTDGSACLRELLEKPDPDRILVVAVDARLDRDAASSVWVKSFDAHGVIVEVQPIERADLPGFLTARAAQLGLTITPGVAELLADRVEGNLLAAEQELMKLAMLKPKGSIDEADVLESVATSARFDVYRLPDVLLAGDGKRALRMLASLRDEGVSPPQVSWALSNGLALLARLQFAAAHGENVDGAMARLRIWRNRQPAIKQALKRFAGRPLAPLLAEAARVDGVLKGLERGQPWEALTGLVLAVVAAAPADRAVGGR